MSVAGAYWRGTPDNKMFAKNIWNGVSKSRTRRASVAGRGQETGSSEAGKRARALYVFGGSAWHAFLLPNGMIIRNELEQFARGLQFHRDYDEVRSADDEQAAVGNVRSLGSLQRQYVFHASGRDGVCAEADELSRAYVSLQNSPHSYREPIRISEFGQVHRHEFSGALNGMMRVRTFCQDDAHIFVRPDQIQEEIKQVIDFISQVYQVFGFDYTIELSTRPEDSMGAEELWEQAESSLKQVLDQLGPYRINEGDGAFYGPKIDFHLGFLAKLAMRHHSTDFQFLKNSIYRISEKITRSIGRLLFTGRYLDPSSDLSGFLQSITVGLSRCGWLPYRL